MIYLSGQWHILTLRPFQKRASYQDMSPVEILIVDDFQGWRHAIASMLRDKPHLRVVCDVSDGLDAVEKAEKLQPDLILLDIGLPSLNGIAAAQMIRERSPLSKILFVSDISSYDVAQAALRTGAHGFVVKLDAGRELLPAVEAVIRGESYVSSRLGNDDLRETAKVTTCGNHFQFIRLHAQKPAVIREEHKR
jgi:DNA-binding NarL/FixJ family response regulator